MVVHTQPCFSRANLFAESTHIEVASGGEDSQPALVGLVTVPLQPPRHRRAAEAPGGTTTSGGTPGGSGPGVPGSSDALLMMRKNGVATVTYAEGKMEVTLAAFRTVSGTATGVRYSAVTDCLFVMEEAGHECVVRAYRAWRVCCNASEVPAESFALPGVTGGSVAMAVCDLTDHVVVGSGSGGQPAGAVVWRVPSGTREPPVRRLDIQVPLHHLRHCAISSNHIAFASSAEVILARVHFTRPSEGHSDPPSDKHLDNEERPRPYHPGLETAASMDLYRTVEAPPVMLPTIVSERTDLGTVAESTFPTDVFTWTRGGSSSQGTAAHSAMHAMAMAALRVGDGTSGEGTVECVLWRRFEEAESIHTLTLAHLPALLSVTALVMAADGLEEPGSRPALTGRDAPMSLSPHMVVSTTRNTFTYECTPSPSLVSTAEHAATCLEVILGPTFMFALTLVGVELWALGTSGLLRFVGAPRPAALAAQGRPDPGRHYQCLCASQDKFIVLEIAKSNQQAGSDSRIPPIEFDIRDENLFDDDAGEARRESVAAEARVVVFEFAPLEEIVDTLLSAAGAAQEAALSGDGHASFRLLNEAYMILVNGVLVGRLEDAGVPAVEGGEEDAALAMTAGLGHHNVVATAQEIAAKVADHLWAKEKFIPAMVMSSYSNVKITSVLDKASLCPDAAIAYLNAVLFDEARLAAAWGDGGEVAEVSNKILRLCAEFNPALLSTVITESYLTKFSRQLALRLLDDALGPPACEASSPRGGAVQRSARSGQAKEMLARALLSLGVGEAQDAVGYLMSLQHRQLFDICKSHIHLIVPGVYSSVPGSPRRGKWRRAMSMDNTGSAGDPPSLAEILLENAPFCMLDLVIMVGDQITVDAALEMLKCEDEHLAASLQEMYIESVLSSQRTVDLPKHVTRNLVHHLAESYLGHLTSRDFPGISQDHAAQSNAKPRARSSHSTVPTYAHISRYMVPLEKRWNRLEFLDFLPPFNRESAQTTPRSTGSRSESPRPRDDRRELLTGKHADFAHAYMRKFQALLSGDVARDDQALLKLIENSRAFPGKDSLRLLTLPRMGNEQLREAFGLILDTHPAVAVEYAKAICKSHPPHWRMFVRCLLDRYNDMLPEEKPRSFVTAGVREVMDHVSNQLEPESFIQVLPDDGNVAFFLPYITRCFAVFKNRFVKQSLKEEVAKIERETRIPE